MLREWLLLSRIKPHWLIMVACAIALSPSPQVVYAALLVIFAYSNAIYGELVNMFYDQSIDKQNPKMKKYPHVTGKISPTSIKKAANIFLFITLFSGATLLAIKKDVILLMLILLALNATCGYSVPPLRIKRYWWAGLATYTPSAALVLLISATILGSEMVPTTMAAFGFWISSLSLWMLAGIPDKQYDQKEGVATPATKFGEKKCVILYLPLALLSIIVSAAIVVTSLGSAYASTLFLIPATIVITAYSRMKKELPTGITKNTLNFAILHHRYNLVFVTLAYFII